jgi:hypothetical protein
VTLIAYSFGDGRARLVEPQYQVLGSEEDAPSDSGHDWQLSTLDTHTD